ncbi:hypothetical protein D3C71_1591410 [compost metagenome]
MHGQGGNAQHTYRAALHRRDALARGIAQCDLFVAPGAAAAVGAQHLGQAVQGQRGAVAGVGLKPPGAVALHQIDAHGAQILQAQLRQQTALHRADRVAGNLQRFPRQERRLVGSGAFAQHPVRQPAHKVRMVEPVVLRASRSRWACCTSRKA